MAVDKPDKTRTRAGPTAAHEKSREGQSAVAGGDLEDFDEDGSGGGALALAAAREIERQLGGALKPGLYLVATPIGNLGDMTLRGLAVLAACDVIYCEDTRHSRTLMQHYAIRTRLRPYHEHNAASQRPRILSELGEGRTVALISDAGTPLISDPGFKLVREALDAGHGVVSLPGASAALVALTGSGLPTDAFLFAGFLPPRSAARKARIEALKQAAASVILYEAPSRIAETLADLAAVLGPRPAAVARELTKLHEDVMRGSLDQLAARFSDGGARGEFAIVIGPPAEGEVGDAAIAEALSDALQDMRLKEAARVVADALGVARNRVYEIGLRLKGEREP